MFRKIVTELAYSPALAGSLGNYLKQVRNEKSKRQIGLIFIFLAVVVQLFAVLYPPESANANNPTVFIDGGIASVEDYLTYYDQNTKNIRDLFTSLGISRTEIEAVQQGAIPQGEALRWSMQDSHTRDTAALLFQTTSGKLGVAYYQPISFRDATTTAFVGSSQGHWFAIDPGTGSLTTEKQPPIDCLASSITPVIISSWSDTTACADTLQLSLSARAISPSSSDPLHIVNASDRVAYTLSITNISDTAIPLAPAISLGDILEYSRILDNGGGEYDYDTKTLNWPAATLAKGEHLERSFIIQLLPTVPSTARGEYSTDSYDCIMTATFGETIALPVHCPNVKYIERSTDTLPKLSVQSSLIATSFLLVVTAYLYLRSRQLLTELYIIRHIYLGGL